MHVCECGHLMGFNSYFGAFYCTKCGAMRPADSKGNPAVVPLTLDELLSMEGEPVWVVWPDGRIKSQWWIVGNSDWRMMEFFDDKADRECGKVWIAYRDKVID